MIVYQLYILYNIYIYIRKISRRTYEVYKIYNITILYKSLKNKYYERVIKHNKKV